MKVIRMNLERHHTRRDFINGALVAMGFKYEDIFVWKAKDNFSYEKTYQLYEDAVRDGFPHFQIMLDTYMDDKVPISFASQHWNWCRILRHIANESDDPVIVLLDKFYFQVGPEKIEKLLDAAQNTAAAEKVPLKFVALDYDSRPKHIKSPVELVPPENIFIRGIPSYAVDKASIITPIGADWLLTEWMKSAEPPFGRFSASLEHALYKKMCHFVDLSGVYTVAHPRIIKPMPGSLAPSAMHILKEGGKEDGKLISEQSVRTTEETQRKRG